jgi:hypothetical protein
LDETCRAGHGGSELADVRQREVGGVDRQWWWRRGDGSAGGVMATLGVEWQRRVTSRGRPAALWHGAVAGNTAWVGAAQRGAVPAGKAQYGVGVAGVRQGRWLRPAGGL